MPYTQVNAKDLLRRPNMLHFGLNKTVHVSTGLLHELTQFKSSKKAAIICTPIGKDLAGK